ncbi:hypothetical protein [Massilia rubra]|uniref:hypothetical protein n=1 Tax=Massilia rubra TaxID=2607910 RepID=UPI00141E8A50|nr:hypothetical protein [Massilia rubra]
MRVTIEANGFVLTEALRSYTEQRLSMALGRATMGRATMGGAGHAAPGRGNGAAG